MPLLSGKVSSGLIVLPVVVFPGDQDVSEDARMAPCHALLDTGASNSGVAPFLAEQLNLLSISKRQVSTANGVVVKDCYRVHVGIPEFEQTSVDDEGRVETSLKVNLNLIATECDIEEGGPFQFILGMDVICRGLLSISSNGYSFAV